MTLSEGKLERMQRVANPRGIIAAAAMDQRGSLEKAIQKEKGGTEVPAPIMEEFKAAVTKYLTPYASAILLDPEYGLPASRARASNAGLLLAYEKSGYDNTRPGRQPDLLPNWTVRKLLEQGTDAIKLLIYYSPVADAAVNAEKHSLVERVGTECAFHQVPFFLEFVGYDVGGGDEKGPAYSRQKPELVTRSIAEFSQPHYQVDVLKVEIPVNLKYVEGTRAFKGPRVWTRTEALASYRQAASAAKKPFIYLSAGVSNAEFLESLELAAEAGTGFHGVLCGRATWQDGIPVYARQGLTSFEKWLADVGVRNIQALNERLQAASPWFTPYGVRSAEELRAVERVGRA